MSLLLSNGNMYTQAKIQNPDNASWLRVFSAAAEYIALFLDIDECKIDNGGCAKHSTCKNTVGSYECVCDTGFKAKGKHCVGMLLVLLHVMITS